MPITPQDHLHMRSALEQAKLAATLGEVPIGAVITQNNQEIARGYNQVESTKDACSHAELIAIKAASLILNKWRLEECDLYVTLDPCPMCLGAIRLARIKRVIVGALDSRMGAITNYPALASDSKLGPSPEIITGVLQEECQLVLREFFKDLRY